MTDGARKRAAAPQAGKKATPTPRYPGDRLSVEFFTALAENSTVGVCLIQDGVFQYVNPRLTELLGYGPNEIVSKKGLGDMVVPEDWPLVEKKLLKRLEGRTRDVNHLFRCRRKNGDIIHLEAHGSRTAHHGKAAVICTVVDITERLNAEAALRRSEERYRTMIEFSNDLIWTLDREGNFTWVNRRAEEVSGYRLEDWVGKSFAPMIPPDDLPEVTKIVLETLAGKTQTYEVDVLRADGSVFTLSVNTTPIYDSGEIVGVANFGRDVTDQKKTEAALRESEERYRKLAEVSPDGICVYAAAKIVYVNPAGAKMLGAGSASELVGRNMMDFVHRDYRAIATERVLAMLTEGETAPLTEEKFLRLNGESFDVEVAAVPTAHEGRPAIQVVVRDVSDRIKARDALRESEERFRAVAQSAVEGIIVADDAGEIVFWNKGAQAMFGYSAQEMQGKPLTVLMSEESADDYRDGIRRYHANGQDSVIGRTIETHGLDKDGAAFPIEISVASWSSKEQTFFSAIFRDISAHKETEGALRLAVEELDAERQRMRDLARSTIQAQEKERLYLASEIHDDLLQGLVATLYFLEMIDVSKLDQRSQERRESLLEIIRSSLARGRLLINEIEPIRDPGIGLIEAIKKSIDVTLGDNRIKADFAYPDKLPPISISDETNLLRIVQEVLMNIRKHANPTAVKIDISVRRNRLWVEIMDDGVGFDPASVSRSAVGRYGLMSIKERAHLVHGKITVTSRPGKGTTVKGIFPLKRGTDGKH